MHRRHQFEAFVSEQKSLAAFDTEQAAIDLILKHNETKD
jgi:hypothetical protein